MGKSRQRYEYYFIGLDCHAKEFAELGNRGWRYMGPTWGANLEDSDKDIEPSGYVFTREKLGGDSDAHFDLVRSVQSFLGTWAPVVADEKFMKEGWELVEAIEALDWE